MDDGPIPLGAVYAAIEEHIKGAIPGLAYVGTMPEGIEVVSRSYTTRIDQLWRVR